MSEAKVTGETWLDVGPSGWFVRYEHSDHWIDFKAYECVGEEMSPNPGKKLFSDKGGRGGHVYIEDLDKAEVTISGYVKWDGCSEMHFESPHFCGAGDVKDFATAMVKLHELCLLLPSVDNDCAGYDPALNESNDGKEGHG